MSEGSGVILRRYIYRPEWRGEGEELNIPSRHLGREGDDGKEEGGGKEKKTKKKINSPIEILLDRARTVRTSSPQAWPLPYPPPTPSHALVLVPPPSPRGG